MSAWAYYNEHDDAAAEWLRELIAEGLIAPGEVDTRDIQDVSPDDLRSFRQCHFFAGIGIWSVAARIAGIPDDAPLWSGSCPCQPFSSAGKGEGFDDERHLWPAFHYLIEQSGPLLVVGEQVAGNDGDAWLDLVSADMEATGYAFGAAETVACGFGAPHKRSRNYWMGSAVGLADSIGARLEGQRGNGHDGDEPGRVGADAAGPVAAGGEPRIMAFSSGIGRHRPERQSGGRSELTNAGADGSVAMYTDGRIGSDGNPQSGWKHRLLRKNGSIAGKGDSWTQLGISNRMERPGPTNGFWRDPDWIRCRDERWRAVEPGTFPLVDAGAFSNRVALLRGAGNAITLGQAVGWLQACLRSIEVLKAA